MNSFFFFFSAEDTFHLIVTVLVTYLTLAMIGGSLASVLLLFAFQMVSNFWKKYFSFIIDTLQEYGRTRTKVLQYFCSHSANGHLRAYSVNYVFSSATV